MHNTTEAIKLFESKYGKTPKELGFTTIDIYEKQHAFLYAISDEVVKAYKTQQNILRWLLIWYLGPFFINGFVCSYNILVYKDFTHPLFIACCIFGITWILLLFVLWIKCEQTNKLIKIGKTITYLNY